MNKAIVHIDLDTFFVSCERLMNSSLEGKPLIIGGSSDRGVVSSCSYEARRFGVRSGMPMRFARRSCPEAIVIKGDMELYSRKSIEVTEIIKEQAPVMELASVDEFYLDLTGMDRFFGCASWSTELADRVTRESGLPISYGLSTNKTVSKIATGEGKPLGRTEVQSQFIRPFLNPLPIRKIPMVGNQTADSLHRIGIRRIQTLAEMPVDALVALIGKRGETLSKKANGIDNTPVIEYQERKSISTEKTFSSDTIDLVVVKACLSRMVEKLCFDLRKNKRLTSIVTVKVRYTNFDTETKRRKISYSSTDNIIQPIVNELFDALYQRRMRIRLVGVAFSGLVGGHYQIDLFSDTTEAVALYQAIDKMKARYGEKYIQRATSFIKKQA